MGMNSDVLGMLGKLAALRRVPREPDPRVIAHRWSKLSPFMVIAARRTADPAAEFARLREVHAERFTRLRRACIAAATIRDRSLDDPRGPDAAFEELLAEAKRRKYRRTRTRPTPKGTK